MNCEKVQAVLLSGCEEGDSRQDLRDQVQKHLAQCKTCASFRREMMEAAVEPFRNLEKAEAPESVWLKIRASLEERLQEKSRVKAKARLDFFRLIPRPVLGISGAMAFALAVFLVLQPVPQRGSVATGISPGDPVLYLMGVNGTSERESESSGDYLGAPIEYFLMD